MKLKEVLDILSCKNGDELFNKIDEILINFDLSVYNDDGTVKGLHALCCEVAEVLNKMG